MNSEKTRMCDSRDVQQVQKWKHYITFYKLEYHIKYNNKDKSIKDDSRLVNSII